MAGKKPSYLIVAPPPKLRCVYMHTYKKQKIRFLSQAHGFPRLALKVFKSRKIGLVDSLVSTRANGLAKARPKIGAKKGPMILLRLR